jgi:hypothetical protein
MVVTIQTEWGILIDKMEGIKIRITDHTIRINTINMGEEDISQVWDRCKIKDMGSNNRTIQTTHMGDIMCNRRGNLMMPFY